MAKIRKSLGKMTVTITAPDYAEARSIGKEIQGFVPEEFGRSKPKYVKNGTAGDTQRDRLIALYGARDFPDL